MFHGVECLIVGLVFPASVFGGNLFLIAPFPDLCYLYLFIIIYPLMWDILSGLFIWVRAPRQRKRLMEYLHTDGSVT